MKDFLKSWVDLTMREQQVNHIVLPIFTGLLILGIILVYGKLIPLPARVLNILFPVYCIALYPTLYILVLVLQRKKQEKENSRNLQEEIKKLEDDEVETKDYTA